MKTSHDLAVPADVGIDQEKLDDLLARAQREIERGILPASQIALAKDGRLVAFETFGDATDTTKFVIFSCTKAFVCAAVWMLLGERKLSLEQRVTELVPGFGANEKETVTLEHVLTHGAGFPNAFLDPFAFADRDRRLKEFASWPLEWEPGTRFEYHGTSGHWVLAHLIEEVTGTDFRDVVRARITEPLALNDFKLGVPPADQGEVAELVVVPGVPDPDELEAAIGLRHLPSGMVVHDLLATLNDPALRATGIPAGAGISTAADVAMFYQALLRNPDEMWSPALLADATGRIRNAHPDPQRGFPMNYALGVRIAGEDGRGVQRGLANRPRVFGHDGAGGMLAFADPDSGMSFCYLTNGLDDDLLRQWRRMAGISHRAIACVS